MKELILVAILFSAIGLGIYLKTNFPLIPNFNNHNSQIMDASSTISEDDGNSSQANIQTNRYSTRKTKKTAKQNYSQDSSQDSLQDYPRQDPSANSGQDEQNVSVVNAPPEINKSPEISQETPIVENNSKQSLTQQAPALLTSIPQKTSLPSSSLLSSITASSSISIPALTSVLASVPAIDSRLRGNDDKIIPAEAAPIRISSSIATASISASTFSTSSAISMPTIDDQSNISEAKPTEATSTEAAPIMEQTPASAPALSSLIVSTTPGNASIPPIISQIQIPISAPIQIQISTSSLSLAPIPIAPIPTIEKTIPSIAKKVALTNLAPISASMPISTIKTNSQKIVKSAKIVKSTKKILEKKIKKIAKKTAPTASSSAPSHSSHIAPPKTICNCSTASAPTSSATPAPILTNTPILNSGKIIVAEIMIGKKGNNGYEFIKLYNPTPNIIDLTNWSIKKNGSTLVSKKHFKDKKIFPGRYFLLAKKDGYDGSMPADILWPKSYSLSRTNETIILYDAAKNRIQEISWDKFPKDKIMKRAPLNSDKFIFENP